MLSVLFIAGCAANAKQEHVSTAIKVCEQHQGYYWFYAKESGIADEIKMTVSCNDNTLIEYYGKPQ